MKKNNTLTVIFSIIGAVVVIAGAVAAIIHFWDDIKAHLPCKCKNECDDFCDELDDIVEEEEAVEFIDYEEEV